MSITEISNYLRELLERVQGAKSHVVDGVVSTSYDTLNLFSGGYYEVFETYEEVKDGETERFFLENLETSGTSRIADVTNITIQSQGRLDVESRFNVTVDSSGTELDPRNKDTSIEDDQDVDAYKGGEYSGGEDPMTAILPAGEGEAIFGSSIQTEAVLIPQGNNLLLEIFNDSGRTVDFSIQVEFAEVKRPT